MPDSLPPMVPLKSIKTVFQTRRWSRWILGIVVVAAVYSLMGFMVVPRVIRWQMMSRLPELSHRQPGIGQVLVNPFRLTLTVSNLSLTEPDGRLFGSVERLYADVEWASLWRRELVLREIQAIRPYVELKRMSNGIWNVADLVSTGPQTNGSGLPRVSIERIQFSEGEFGLRDEAVPGVFSKRFSSLELVLDRFSTREDDRASGHLNATGDSGEILNWKGTVGVAPLASVGEVRLDGFPLPRHGVYLQLVTAGAVERGQLSFGFQHELQESPDGMLAAVSGAFVRLRDIALSLPQANQPSVSLGTLAVNDVSGSLQDRRIRVGEILVEDGTVSALRGSDGTVDLARAIRPEFVEESLHALAAAFAGWRVEISRIQSDRLGLAWRDSLVAGASSEPLLSATLDSLRIEGLSNQSNQPVSLSLSTRGGQGGTLQATVEGTLLPPSASASVQLGQLHLAVAQPYLADLLNVRLQNGLVSGRVEASYNRVPAGPLLSAQASVEVKDFLAFDLVSSRDFVKWDALRLTGIEAAWEPGTVRVGELLLVSPATSFVLMTNGQLNVMSLLRRPLADPNQEVPAAVPSTASVMTDLTVALDRLVVTNASLYAADQTVPGAFANTLERFSGQVTGLTWPQASKARVELEGFVGARAPFRVDGWVTPDPKHPLIDMHVTATNAELVPFTPYALKFAGHPLTEGRITADVRYQVDGRQVRGENHIQLDRLTLGSRQEPKPVLDLPFKLGVAILKDRDGRITLDIPVSGSLDDPQFGVGKVVWQAVRSLMVKAATAPFRLLGSIFGGGEEAGLELQQVTFEPGSSKLTAEAVRRLERLVQALQNRPELRLSMEGGVSPDEDGPVLARMALTNALIQLRREERQASGSAGESEPDGLSAEEYARWLPILFQKGAIPAVAKDTAAPAVLEPGVPATPPIAEMERELLVKFQPDAARVQALRRAREESVREWLLGPQRLAPERLVDREAPVAGVNPLRQRVVAFSLE